MLILPSAYLAPVQYYAHLIAAPCAVEDRGEHYVKQTYRNRCYIATPSGPQPLTVPIVRDGAARMPMRDIRLSDHGNWRHLHRQALISAYERSPFFEYYADDILPLYERDYRFLVDFNEAFRHAVLALLELDRTVTPADTYVSEVPDEAVDLRAALSPKAAPEADPRFSPAPYYQVFAGRTGFLPNLSIIDLLSCMGPESRLVLRRSLRAAD